MANGSDEILLKLRADVTDVTTKLSAVQASVAKIALGARGADASTDALSAATVELQQRLVKLEDELERVNRQLMRTPAISKQVRSEFASINSTMSTLRTGVMTVVGSFAAMKLRQLASESRDVAIQFASLESTMRAAVGPDKVAKELAFVREQADRLGQNVIVTAESYAKFAAAARGTALEGEKLRDIFTAVMEAQTVMGGSAEETRGVLYALQQIVSKGKVSMEELSQQLGDRLPGALQIAAKAMGVTTKELLDMVKGGNLLATDFLPKFGVELKKRFAEELPNAIASSRAQLERMSNAALDMKRTFGESILKGFTADVGDVGDAAKEATPHVKQLGEAMGETSAELVKALPLLVGVVNGVQGLGNIVGGVASTIIGSVAQGIASVNVLLVGAVEKTTALFADAIPQWVKSFRRGGDEFKEASENLLRQGFKDIEFGFAALGKAATAFAGGPMKEATEALKDGAEEAPKFGAKFQEAAAKYGDMVSTLSAAAQELVGGGETLDELKKKVVVLGEAYDFLTARGKMTHGEMVRLRDAAEELAKGYKELGEKAPKEVEAVLAATISVAKETKKAADETKVWREEIKQLRSELGELKNEIQGGIEMSREKFGIGALEEEVGDLKERLKELNSIEGPLTVEQLNELNDSSDSLKKKQTELNRAIRDSGMEFEAVRLEVVENQIAAAELEEKNIELADSYGAAGYGAATFAGQMGVGADILRQGVLQTRSLDEALAAAADSTRMMSAEITASGQAVGHFQRDAAATQHNMEELGATYKDVSSAAIDHAAATSEGSAATDEFAEAVSRAKEYIDMHAAALKKVSDEKDKHIAAANEIGQAYQKWIAAARTELNGMLSDCQKLQECLRSTSGAM